MAKKLLFILVIFFLFIPKSVFAQESRNNKFGIHIIDESDLEKASELVNSNGGEWGYVTIVIREDERIVERWQKVFDQMRRFKLIPIVRLATKSEGVNWKKPTEQDALPWAEFLNKLKWPVKERLVVLFNEPNHAKEWGGKVDPISYAKVVKSFETELRTASTDFSILPGALDLSAPNSGTTMSASRFFDIAHEEDNFIFTRFDYWNSHSYPNPAFSSPPQDTGPKSISGFKWELDYLKDYGLNPEIEVFITETGWVRSGEVDENKIAEYYTHAFDNVWNDSRVRAVTPFLLNYSEGLFEKFSWINREENRNYKYFDTIKERQKVKGEPEQIHSYEISSYSLAKQLVAQSEYTFKLSLKNTGQSIWSKENGFSLHYSSTLDGTQVNISEITETEPNQEAEVVIKITTMDIGKHQLSLSLNKDGKEIGEKIDKNFEILTPPAMEVKVLGWFGLSDTSDEYNLAMMDEDRTVFEISKLEVIKGIANIPSLYNIVPGKQYRIKIERKFHIAKEKLTNIDPIKSYLDFGRLFPSVDIEKFIERPLETEQLISPF